MFWEDEPPEAARALKRLHPAGLFEGRLPYRRPLVPYRVRVRYPDGHTAAEARSVLLRPAADGLRPAPVRRGQPLPHLVQARRPPGHARRPRRHALRGLGAECRAGQRGRAASTCGTGAATRCRRGPRAACGSCSSRTSAPGELYKYEIRTAGGGTRLKSDPYGFAMQLRPGQLLGGRRARRLRVAGRRVARRARAAPIRGASRSTSTSCTSARGGASPGASRRS